MARKISDDDLIHMYTRQGRGYTDQALADHFEVGREAIFKRRQKLEVKYPFKETEYGRWRIDTDQIISHIPVTPSEALVLYLATRRFGRNTPVAKRFVKEALEKLAPALYKPMTEKLVDAAKNALEHPDEAQREALLQKLMTAWSEKRVLRVKYQALWRNESIWHEVSPYLIEPSPWSDSVYVIGHSTTNDTIIPLSVERIEKVVETSAPFKECSPETEMQLLKNAWGIWGSDKVPELVKLHFTGRRAVRRLRESLWHPEQEIDGPDNHSYVTWQALIADWREMLPWIRGWGADVEVVEPEGLRESIKTHVWKLAQIYTLTTQTDNIDLRLLRLWGKTTKNPDLFHPALYHMFDVAHIAQQLLSPRASSRWRRVLAAALNAEAETLSEWLPYLIALHDIGKISVPFQVLNDRQRQRLKAEGFDLGKVTQAEGRKLHHSIVGRLVLPDEVVAWPKNLAVAFSEMVSGHHGVFQREDSTHERDFKGMRETDEWGQLRQRAKQILASYLCQQWPDPLPNPSNQSTAMMALNGFCILCDWLGSDEAYFTPAPLTPLPEYILKSRQQAYKRVRDAGFFQKAVSTAPTQFAALFPDIPQARPLQTAIDDIPDDLLRQPTLTIIEAPTGEGKTETALTLARRIGALRGTDEMYIALPTTATSNAMFDRVQEHLEKRLGLSQDMVRLIHGQDFLKKHDLPTEPMESVEPGQDAPSESPALTWFAPKKRALLAPIGVGTIDQAELSALNVRHNALRMIGLAGKTIILDEVHAYDTYMTTIIKRMLTWLSALGSSVILLSATLPKKRRQELAQAFAGEGAQAELNLEAYPNLLTIGPAGHHLATPAPFQPGKTLFLHHQPFAADDATGKAAWLLEQVQQGGCVCWITNTVKRAQQIYAALLRNPPADVDLDLLHARFPLNVREKREQAIMKKYSKDGQRPARGIVVGTQVLEQSLDLDFDVMMTDLAPVDLVLQRAGRLQRHERAAAVRYGHKEPHLYLNTTLEKADKIIYDDYILQKTLLALVKRDSLALPEDYRPLIEAVYDGTEPGSKDPLYDSWDKLDTNQIKLEGEAKLRLMNDPNPDYPFYRGAKPRDFKEDEESSGWLVAQTRWGQESITVIPLLRDGELARTTSGEVSAAINQKADRETQLELLRHSLRLSHRDLVKHLKASTETCKLFADSALLRSCVPLWLEPGETEGTFVNHKLPLPVILHPELGLVIGELG